VRITIQFVELQAGTMIPTFIGLSVLLVIMALAVESKGAGECAMLCNDLRLEVLTNEMCR
jgi:hypothetical protein